MSSNWVLFNPTKYINQQLTKLHHHRCQFTSCKLYNHVISATVRYLGVTLDQEHTFAPRIHCLCHDYYYRLCQICTISHSLTFTATTTLLHSIVKAWLLLQTIQHTLAVWQRCLDRVMRFAACLILGISRAGHVSDPPAPCAYSLWNGPERCLSAMLIY